MENKTKVLIIGAGPTGLMAACQLAMRGIPLRIVDISNGPTTQSRALAIQARSMEIFEQMGIVDEFLAEGHPAKALNMLINGKSKARLDISKISAVQTKYPYVFMLEQSKTERIMLKLLESLGVKVEWNTELVNFSQDTFAVTVTLKTSAGETEVQADYLIGADGARSIVRQKLNLTYEGKTYHQDFFVLDCDLSDWDIAKNEIYICLSQNSFAAFFPMQSTEYRVIGVMPHSAKSLKITFDDVYPDFLRGLGVPAKLSNPKWISEYHSHHRRVNTFRVARCFVAGDAAHIHSPVGAQGMNTGLQDAANLAWKLALVINGQAKDDLLNSYHHERFQVASKLVHTVDQVFNLIVSNNGFVRFVRNYIIPQVLKSVFNTKAFREKLFKIVSETGISYADSILSKNGASNFALNSPKAGERIAYSPMVEKYLNKTKLQLLIFGDESATKVIIEQLNIHWRVLLDIHQIIPDSENESLYKLFGIGLGSAGAYLIRPDRHVAFRGEADLIAIQNYLTVTMDLVPALA